jgi:hypothetical protein
MPPVKGKAAQFNLSTSLKSHAKDETEYGQDFTRLPGGIIGGVARLVEAKRGLYKTGKNQGEPVIQLRGVVVKPREALHTVRTFENGAIKTLGATMVKVEGLFTQLFLPLCTTKNKRGEITEADDNVKDACNELRKLGGDECTSGLSSEEDLDALLATLKASGIYFRFSTSELDPTAEYPNPMVFERWLGTKGVEDFSVNGTPDGTGTAPGVDDRTTGSKAATAAGEPATEDLAALAEQANSDEDAGNRLTALAVEAGCDAEEVKSAPNWKAVVEMIEKAQAEGGTSTEPAPDWEPAAGEIYSFHPYDPKTKKPSAKAVEVEVTAIQKKNKTVELKNLGNPKISYKNVKWDELESAS